MEKYSDSRRTSHGSIPVPRHLYNSNDKSQSRGWHICIIWNKNNIISGDSNTSEFIEETFTYLQSLSNEGVIIFHWDWAQ